jgi:aspartyl-tRNA(Asn)/glutamyl-tRNA(Gln) amidotransferase subunit B
VTLRQLGVSDVNMEEGSLRADANVSVRRKGETELGTKTELKNMNSFRFLMQGINAEVKRQVAVLEGGDRVVQETLHFDPGSGRLNTLRSKEEAHDYRYFPEPDLVPVVPDEEMRAEARAALPELPAERAERYAADWEIQEDTARLFAFEPEWGDFFEEAATAAAPLPARPVANLVLELRTRLDGAEPTTSPASAQAIAALARLVEDRKTTPGNARKVLDVLAVEGGDPQAIVEREGLGAMADDGELAGIVAQVIADNQDVVERIKGGNAKAMGALVGPIMKATRGRADGGEVNRLIREQLEL